jgi:hypothetical protein
MANEQRIIIISLKLSENFKQFTLIPLIFSNKYSHRIQRCESSKRSDALDYFPRENLRRSCKGSLHQVCSALDITAFMAV